MSLGWLTEGALVPKRAKQIVNVDTGTIMGLKAALYTAEIQLASGVEAVRTKHTPKSKPDLFNQKNAGVEDRNRRDEEAVANQQQSGYEQLQKKAAMYDMLAQGKLKPEGKNQLIDFQRKVWDEDDDRKSASATDRDVSGSSYTPQLNAQTSAEEQERLEWEAMARGEVETGVIKSTTEASKVTFASAARQGYQRTLSAEEKNALLKLSEETVAAREKQEVNKQDKRYQLDRKRALIAEMNAKKKQRLAGGVAGSSSVSEPEDAEPGSAPVTSTTPAGFATDIVATPVHTAVPTRSSAPLHSSPAAGTVPPRKSRFSQSVPASSSSFPPAQMPQPSLNWPSNVSRVQTPTLPPSQAVFMPSGNPAASFPTNYPPYPPYPPFPSFPPLPGFPMPPPMPPMSMPPMPMPPHLPTHMPHDILPSPEPPTSGSHSLGAVHPDRQARFAGQFSIAPSTRPLPLPHHSGSAQFASPAPLASVAATFLSGLTRPSPANQPSSQSQAQDDDDDDFGPKRPPV